MKCQGLQKSLQIYVFDFLNKNSQMPEQSSIAYISL